MALDALPVEHIGTITAATNDVERPMVKGGPWGTKMVATVTAATFVGPKVNASMVPGVAGGDWVTLRPDRTFSLDVRLSLRTDDGADIYISYVGIGGADDDGNTVIRTSPRFETGDERYTWLNSLVCIAIGSTDDNGVTYEVYAVTATPE